MDRLESSRESSGPFPRLDQEEVLTCGSTTPAALSPADLPSHVTRISQSQGWQAGISLISQHWDGLALTHPDALLRAIKALPGAALVEVPSMLVAANYLRHVARVDDPRRFHDLVVDDLGPDRDGSNLLNELIASAGRSAGHRTAGRFEAALSSTLEGLALLDGATEVERSEVHSSLPELLTQWGRTLEIAEAGGAREYEEAWELAELSGQPNIARRAASSLAWLHADKGRLNSATHWIERAQTRESSAPRYEAGLHLASALIGSDRLDHASTQRHLHILDRLPLGEYWSAALWVRAWSARTVDEAAIVQQRLDAETQRQSQTFLGKSVHRRYLIAAHARLATLQNRALPVYPEEIAPSAFDHTMAAAAAYRAGRPHVVITEARSAIALPHGPRMHTGGLLLMAAAQLTLGRTTAAASTFRAAHALIETEGLYSAYSVLARSHADELFQLTGLKRRRRHREAAGLKDDQRSSSAELAVSLGSLTRREREVLTLLASARTLPMIANELYISSNTVKAITRNMYRKLGVHSRTEAADVAHRAGLI